MGIVASDPEKNIAWIERVCRIPEGSMVGQPVKLCDFQKEIIRGIYGSQTRRAIISFGRKNAKTTLSAFLLLLHLCGPEARPNSQLFSAAQSRDQAAVLFALAAKIVRMSPELVDFVGIRDTAKQLYCPEIGTLYRALSAEASTAFGLSPVFVVHDELGQVKGPRSELYEALETASAAHERPLSVVISTQAPTDADLLSILIDDALSNKDPRVKCWLYSADKEADPFSEETIRQANPAFAFFMNQEEVIAQAEDARRMPSREPEFRNLILNQRVEASNPYIPPSVWKENSGSPDEIEDFPVYIGLDLSATTDLTALVMVAPEGELRHVHCTFWLPANGLREKSEKDRVPYFQWHQEGFLETTPGSTVEYEYVAHRLREIFDTYDVRKVCFDRWNFRFLKPWLERAGFDESEMERFEQFGQGYASMSPALRELETVLMEGKMRHGGHPVLNMCAANAVVQRDPAGNRKLAKDKSSGRIDGMVALAMAIAAASGEQEEYATGRLVAI